MGATESWNELAYWANGFKDFSCRATCVCILAKSTFLCRLYMNIQGSSSNDIYHCKWKIYVYKKLKTAMIISTAVIIDVFSFKTFLFPWMHFSVIWQQAGLVDVSRTSLSNDHWCPFNYNCYFSWMFSSVTWSTSWCCWSFWDIFGVKIPSGEEMGCLVFSRFSVSILQMPALDPCLEKQWRNCPSQHVQVANAL